MKTTLRNVCLSAVVVAFLATPVVSAHGGSVSALNAFAESQANFSPGFLGDGPDIIQSIGGTNSESADSDDDDDSYDTTFKCADLTQNTGSLNPGRSEASTNACPFHVPDPEDIMSQPVLMVDYRDPNLIAFNAMHGGVGFGTRPITAANSPPPSAMARYNILHQPHTTFRSEDGGILWDDNRYYAPEALRGNDDDPSARELFGLDNAATIDGQGKLYLASLYAYRDKTNDPWSYAVAFWKGPKINRPPQYNCCLQIVGPDNGGPEPGAKIDKISLIWVPNTDVILFSQRVQMPEGAKDSKHRNLNSYIDFWYTKVGSNGNWKHINSQQVIGPCKDSTETIQFRGVAYIGCMPDEGYRYDPLNATLDHLQIHSIDTQNWFTRYAGPTTLGKGTTSHYKLATLWDSYMVALESGVADDKIYVDLNYGEFGTGWSDPYTHGSEIEQKLRTADPRDPNENPRANHKITDAKITAAAFKTDSGEIRLIYMERYEVDETDPNNIDVPGYQKYYVSIRHFGNVNKVKTLGVGDPSFRKNSPYSVAYSGLTDDVYIDAHDSIVMWKVPKQDKHREFLAYGDYGYVRFAEVKEVDAGIFVPFPPTELSAIPVAEAVSNASLTSSAAGVIFGFMVLRLLSAKKKATAKVPVGAEK